MSESTTRPAAPLSPQPPAASIANRLWSPRWGQPTRQPTTPPPAASTQLPPALDHVVALVGGEGGARIAAGLQAELAPGALTVVATASDDFDHWGLHVSPQLDGAMFYLAAASGWGGAEGRRGESFGVLEAMDQLGGEDWLALSDRELAVALRRTQWRREGLSFSTISDRLRRSFGIPSALLPASDAPVQTLLHTDEGDLPFAHYALRREHEPVVFDISFLGAPAAQPSPAVLQALHQAQLVLICVDNPYLWLDSLLALPALRRLLIQHPAPVLFVSPLETGKDFDAPLGKLMRELGHYASPLTFADRYAPLLDGCVIAPVDEVIRDALPTPALAVDLDTHTFEQTRRLTRALLDFGARLQTPSIPSALPALRQNDRVSI